MCLSCQMEQCEQGQTRFNHYWVGQPFSGFLKSSSLYTIILGLWTWLVGLTYKHGSPIIYKKFQTSSKATRPQPWLFKNSHFFMLTSSRCCPRWRPRPCLNESIFYPFHLETCIFQKNIKVFPTIATFLNLKNKANVCEWVNLRHAYGTYNVKSMKKKFIFWNWWSPNVKTNDKF